MSHIIDPISMEERRLKNAHILKEIKKLKNKEHQLAIVAPLLMDDNLWEVIPYVEYPVKVRSSGKDYRIDLYYPVLKLAIEVNEVYHSGNEQSKKDSQRESDIIGELDCEFVHVNVYEDGFIHIDKIHELKSNLKSRIDKLGDDNWWRPKLFDVEKALEDHSGLIFVNTGRSSGPFPKFQLKKDLLHQDNLTIAVVSDSKQTFNLNNLKSVDHVYDKISILSHENNGYVSWSGQTTQHSIIQSGETQIRFSGRSYHKLGNRQQRRSKK